MKYYARAAHLKALENLKAKVLPCFKYVVTFGVLLIVSAAATATGCTVQITTDVLTNDLRNCPTLTVSFINLLCYGL